MPESVKPIVSIGSAESSRISKAHSRMAVLMNNELFGTFSAIVSHQVMRHTLVGNMLSDAYPCRRMSESNTQSPTARFADLLPKPYVSGLISSRSWPVASSQRSGLNCPGSGKTAASCPTALYCLVRVLQYRIMVVNIHQWLPKTVAPAGIIY